MGIKVTSTQMCFFHGRRYRPGTVFELPDGVKPSRDMTVVDEKAEAKTPKAKAEPKAKGEPQTFSEIAKQGVKGPADDLV